MKNNFIRHYPVTTGLLFVTTVVFLLMFLTYGFDYSSSEAVFTFGGVYGEVIKMSPLNQGWRLLAASFVHIGLEHFLINTLTLYFIGQQAESIFGSGRFLLLYLLSGVSGNLFVLIFTPNILAAGASTSLFGIFAAIIVLRFIIHNPYIQTLSKTYRRLLLLNLLFSFLPGISLAGHLGGAIGGALTTLLIFKKS